MLLFHVDGTNFGYYTVVSTVASIDESPFTVKLSDARQTRPPVESGPTRPAAQSQASSKRQEACGPFHVKVTGEGLPATSILPAGNLI